MSNPQQPELARSRRTAGQDPDSVAGTVRAVGESGADSPRGPVPTENQPGHHPETEQDTPDLNSFAERLGADGASAGGDGGRTTAPASPATDPGGAVRRRDPRSVARAAAVGGAVAASVGLLTRRRRRRPA